MNELLGLGIARERDGPDLPVLQVHEPVAFGRQCGLAAFRDFARRFGAERRDPDVLLDGIG